MTLLETWKDIEGYEGLYQVSDLGNVKSLTFHRAKKEQVLKLSTDRRGYPQCFLYADGRRRCLSVHRLVAAAFVPNEDSKPQVNHINGIKTDNRAVNLEWCTNTENQHHASERGLKSSVKVMQYDLHGNFVREWGSMAKAAKSVGVTRESIFACCNGQAKTIKGYIWKYKDVAL
jgi:hypothetical protein